MKESVMSNGVSHGLALVFGAISWLSFARGGNVPDAALAKWRNKFIYQIITDRFARSDDSTEPCTDLLGFCGGTWTGIQKKLDYIQGLGAEAIYISPIMRQAPGGYRGYYPMSFSKLNPHMGDETSFAALSDELHRRGMLLLLDWPLNSMGRQWSDIRHMDPPFNRVSGFHDCTACKLAGGGKGQPGCNWDMSNCECSTQDWDNTAQRLYCQLWKLPDIAHVENARVRNFILNATEHIVKTYKVDGLRLDAMISVNPIFWRQFVPQIGVFTIAEIMDGVSDNIKSYLDWASVHAAINYPMYYASRNAMLCPNNEYDYCFSMCFVKEWYEHQLSVMGFDAIQLNGLFNENHDIQRMSHITKDVQKRKAAMLYKLTAVGMPIVFYGEEQAYDQGPDDSDVTRTKPMWSEMGYATTGSKGSWYEFVASVGKLRKLIPPGMFTAATQTFLHCDDHLLLYSRGQVLVALTNGGETAGTILHSANVSTMWHDGEEVCSALAPSADCSNVASGSLTVELKGGESKVYVPKRLLSSGDSEQTEVLMM